MSGKRPFHNMQKGRLTGHLDNKRYYPGWARTVAHIPLRLCRFSGRWTDGHNA